MSYRRIVSLLAAALFGALAAFPAAAQPKDKAILLLNWYVYSEHAPFFLGKERGYFDQEGISYEYRAEKVANKTREQVRKEVKDLSSSRIWIVNDFMPFHGSEGDNGARNFAYLDGHVDAVIVNEDE